MDLGRRVCFNQPGDSASGYLNGECLWPRTLVGAASANRSEPANIQTGKRNDLIWPLTHPVIPLKRQKKDMLVYLFCCYIPFFLVSFVTAELMVCYSPGFYLVSVSAARKSDCTLLYIFKTLMSLLNKLLLLSISDFAQYLN